MAIDPAVAKSEAEHLEAIERLKTSRDFRRIRQRQEEYVEAKAKALLDGNFKTAAELWDAWKEYRAMRDLHELLERDETGCRNNLGVPRPF